MSTQPLQHEAAAAGSACVPLAPIDGPAAVGISLRECFDSSPVGAKRHAADGAQLITDTAFPASAAITDLDMQDQDQMATSQAEEAVAEDAAVADGYQTPDTPCLSALNLVLAETHLGASRAPRICPTQQWPFFCQPSYPRRRRMLWLFR